MYNSKAERFPTNPQVLDDIEIAENFTLAHDKSRFLIKDMKELNPNRKKTEKIIIFGHDTMLKCLCEGSRISSDGTFSFSAALFVQV